MSNLKISQLPAAGPLNDLDILPVVQDDSGTLITSQTTLGSLKGEVGLDLLPLDGSREMTGTITFATSGDLGIHWQTYEEDGWIKYNISSLTLHSAIDITLECENGKVYVDSDELEVQGEFRAKDDAIFETQVTFDGFAEFQNNVEFYDSVSFEGLTVSTVPYLNGSKQLLSSSVTSDGNNFTFANTYGIQWASGSYLKDNISTGVTTLSGTKIAITASDTYLALSANDDITITCGSVMTMTPSELYINPGSGYISVNSSTINFPQQTASRVLTTDGSKNLVSSSVTTTELGYLSGVTSAVQTQINNKLSTSGGTVTGALLSSGTSGVGYATGAGGTVTQATNKSTGVTLNKTCGQITMNGAALAAGAEVAFTLTNSTITATDVVVVSIKSGATAGAYFSAVGATGSGSCSITLGNASAGSLSEAVVLNFVVIKGVTS